MAKWVVPRGGATEGEWDLSIGAAGSRTKLNGWQYTGIKAADIAAGKSVALPAAGEERFVVPIRGAFSVQAGDQHFELRGRSGPFAGPTDVLYVGIDTAVAIRSANGGRVVVASAPATVAYPPQLTPAEDIEVQLRGNGACSREVHNFGMPQNSTQADKLQVCEVITPAGNWSSYPPHKHDDLDAEGVLEEIYYYEVRAADDGDGSDPIGIQRVSSSPGYEIEIASEVRSGDAVFIPYGWHGPSLAVPGYDLYYLNVMAGPGPRAWNVTVDPKRAWIPDSLAAQPIDSRLPLH